MRSTRGATLLLVAALVVGFVVGAGGMLLAQRSGWGPFRPRRHGPRGYVAWLTRELELAPAQQDSVRAVLERWRPAMDSLRRETAPRFETLQRGIRSDIRAQLNPEQQRRFSIMTQRYDAQRAGHADSGKADAPR